MILYIKNLEAWNVHYMSHNNDILPNILQIVFDLPDTVN